MLWSESGEIRSLTFSFCAEADRASIMAAPRHKVLVILVMLLSEFDAKLVIYIGRAPDAVVNKCYSAQNMCAKLRKKKRDTPRMRNVSLYFLGFTLGDAVIKRWC